MIFTLGNMLVSGGADVIHAICVSPIPLLRQIRQVHDFIGSRVRSAENTGVGLVSVQTP